MRCQLGTAALIIAAVTRICVAAAAPADPAPGAARSNPGNDSNPFVVVFIDTATEKSLGLFPYDRALYAKAIERAAALGARGVVVKFFLDKPKSADGDRILVRAMSAVHVVLQARMDPDEPTPNALPDRFKLSLHRDADDQPISGMRGWIPRPEFSTAAYDVGFIDHRVIDRMPLIERYQDRYVKSLYLCCLEMATGHRAEVTAGRLVRLGKQSLRIDTRNEVAVNYPINDDLPYLSFADFIASKGSAAVKDRVVILAYDSDRFEAVSTPAGKMRPHRAFYHALTSIYDQLQAE